MWTKDDSFLYAGLLLHFLAAVTLIENKKSHKYKLPMNQELEEVVLIQF